MVFEEPQIYEFQWLRGAAVSWTTKNPILKAGEPGVEVDTGFFKIGNGHTHWNDLEYFVTEDHVQLLISNAIDDIPGGPGGTSDPRIGDLDDLTTQAKELIVSAINEVNMDGTDFVLLYDNAKAG